MPLLPEQRPRPPGERTSAAQTAIIGSQRENIQSQEFSRQGALVSGAMSQVSRDATDIFRMQVASANSKQAIAMQEGVNAFQQQIIDANEVSELDPVQGSIETFLEKSLTDFPYNTGALEERFTPAIGSLRNQLLSRKKSLLTRDANATAQTAFAQAMSMADGSAESYDNAANHLVATYAGLGEVFGNKAAEAAIQENLPKLALAHALQAMNADPQGFMRNIFALSPEELQQDPILGDLMPEQILQLQNAAVAAAEKDERMNAEVFHSATKNQIEGWVKGRTEMPDSIAQLFMAKTGKDPYAADPTEVLEFFGNEIDFPPTDARSGGVMEFFDDNMINRWKQNYISARKGAAQTAASMDNVLAWIKGMPGSRPPDMHDRQDERAVEMLETFQTNATIGDELVAPTLYGAWDTRDFGSTATFFNTWAETMPVSRTLMNKMMQDFESGGVAGLGAAVAMTEIFNSPQYQKDYHKISSDKAGEIRFFADYALNARGNLEEAAQFLTQQREEARRRGFEFDKELGASRDFVLDPERQESLTDLSSELYDRGPITQRIMGFFGDARTASNVNEKQISGMLGPVRVPEHGEVGRFDMAMAYTLGQLGVPMSKIPGLGSFGVTEEGRLSPVFQAPDVVIDRANIVENIVDFEFGNVRGNALYNEAVAKHMTMFRSMNYDEQTAIEMAVQEAMRTGWSPTLMTKDGQAEWVFRSIEDSDKGKMYGSGHATRNLKIRKHASDDLAAEGIFVDPIDILVVPDSRGQQKFSHATGEQLWSIFYFDRSDPTETERGTWKFLRNEDGSRRHFIPDWENSADGIADRERKEAEAARIEEAMQTGRPIASDLNFLESPEEAAQNRSAEDLGGKLREVFNQKIDSHPTLKEMFTPPTLEELKGMNEVGHNFPHALALLQQRMAFENFDPGLRKKIAKGVATGDVSEEDFRAILKAVLPDEMTPEQFESILSRAALPFVRMGTVTRDINTRMLLQRMEEAARKEGRELPVEIIPLLEEVPLMPEVPKRGRIEREGRDPVLPIDPGLQSRIRSATGDELDAIFAEIQRGSRFRQGAQ